MSMNTLFEQSAHAAAPKPVTYAAPLVLTLPALREGADKIDLLTRCAQEIGATCDAPGAWSMSDSFSTLRLSAEGGAVLLCWWTAQGMETVRVRNVTEFREAMFARPLSDRGPTGDVPSAGTLITPFGLMTYEIKVQRKWAARPHEHDPQRTIEGWRIKLEIERDLKWGTVAFEKLLLDDILSTDGRYSYHGSESLWRKNERGYNWERPSEALKETLSEFKRRVSEAVMTPAMRHRVSLEDARAVLDAARRHLDAQRETLRQERQKLQALQSGEKLPA